MAMEEEIASVVSNGEATVKADISDSSSSTHPLLPPNKRARCVGSHVSSKFKGVVPQPNGHWGAQIYANQQRIWLGTFKTEKEAAMAYDSAAIKLRSADSHTHRNFPCTDITAKEPRFQSFYSTEAIVNMIRDGNYQSKFAEFLRDCSRGVETRTRQNALMKGQLVGKGGIVQRVMFEKELTPSDVGKLNRLVVPKKYASLYFPNISIGGENVKSHTVNHFQLVFYDKFMKLWKFRYCYWRSSQSYVFTKGWNRFVKDKQLKANDIIIFYSCKPNEGQSFFMIDSNKGETSQGVVEEMADDEDAGDQLNLQLQLQQSSVHNVRDGDDEDDARQEKEDRDDAQQEKEEEDAQDAAEEEDMVETKETPTHDTVAKGFKLFGVQII